MVNDASEQNVKLVKNHISRSQDEDSWQEKESRTPFKGSSKKKRTYTIDM